MVTFSLPDRRPPSLPAKLVQACPEPPPPGFPPGTPPSPPPKAQENGLPKTALPQEPLLTRPVPLLAGLMDPAPEYKPRCLDPLGHRRAMVSPEMLREARNVREEGFPELLYALWGVRGELQMPKEKRASFRLA